MRLNTCSLYFALCLVSCKLQLSVAQKSDGSESNPTFLVDGAGEARSCSSQVRFLGWCATSTLTTDRGWLPEEGDVSPEMRITLGGPYLVAGLAVKRMGACCGPAWAVSKFTVEVSVDEAEPLNWTKLGEFSGVTAAHGEEEMVEVKFATPTRARYLKITDIEADEVDGERRIGLRLGMLLTFETAYEATGRTEIPYLGCFNPPPGAAQPAGAETQTPESCNTACLGFDTFSLSGRGHCECWTAGTPYDANGESAQCNTAHHFGNGLVSGCGGGKSSEFLCGGGENRMTYRVTAPSPSTPREGATSTSDPELGEGATSTPLVVGERRSTPHLGSDAREETSWPVRCSTAADIAAVRAKCAIISSLVPSDSRDATVAPETCAATYCLKLLPRADREEEAMPYPATLEDCEKERGSSGGRPCKHYRLQWLFSSQIFKQPAVLVQFIGSELPGGTKWIILPDLASSHPENAGQWDEIREADLWLPSLGEELTGARYFLDTEGEYSRHQDYVAAFYPHYLRLAPVNPDEPEYWEASFNGQFGPIPIFFKPEAVRQFYENLVEPRAIVKHSKFYDIIRPESRCQDADRGGCPFVNGLGDYGGYALSAPSWVELKVFTLSNAFRNNPAAGGERYFGMDANEVAETLTTECGWSRELIVTEGTRPKYMHVDTVELNRLKAWACSRFSDGDTTKTCKHGLPPKDQLDSFGVPDGREWMTDQRDVWPHADVDQVDPNYPQGWVSGGHLAGASHVTHGGATEQIGGPPYVGSCGHFEGFFEPKRSMGAISFYPRESWKADDPLDESTYSVGVQLQLGSAKDDAPGFTLTDAGDYSLWATQPWNNVGLNTYQPIPSGVHLVVDTSRGEAPNHYATCHKCARADRELRFVAQYFDSSGMAPDSFEVLLDGVAHPMRLVVGAPARGTYEYAHPTLGSSEEAPCVEYVFRTQNERGTFYLPQSGRLLFRTYGVGRCDSLWGERQGGASAVAAHRSTCGFPGLPCGERESESESVSGGTSATTTQVDRLCESDAVLKDMMMKGKNVRAKAESLCGCEDLCASDGAWAISFQLKANNPKKSKCICYTKKKKAAKTKKKKGYDSIILEE